MTVERWLAAAVADARARGLDGAVPVLEAFARAMTTLRSAEWNANAAPPAAAGDHASPVTPPVVHDSWRTRIALPPLQPLPPPLAGTEHAAVLDISTASERLRTGALTSVALTEQCLELIDRLDGALNAFITVTRDEALTAARTADAEIARGEWRGPLHGIPISLKDLIDQRGVVTTAGSHARDRIDAVRDAPVTAALRQAGAVLVGKTNLHEFAFGTTSDESAFGPVRHPLDRGRSPGGSSGGSAVAVATGMSLASIGTDTGGSIRIPSAACGVVGLKPGLGELSCDGVVPLSYTLDHVGPLARTVADAALVYRVLAGVPPHTPKPRSIRGLRVGVLREYFEDLLEPDVRTGMAAVQERLQEAGGALVDVRLPHVHDIIAVYLAIVFGEAAAVHGRLLETRADEYQPGVRVRLEAARFVLAEDYLRARKGRHVIRDDVDRALDRCDLLIAPTLPIEAPRVGAGSVTIDGVQHPVRNLMLRLTQPFNISGHPALTIPCGRTSQGLPIGLQLIGRRGGTLPLLECALACEPTAAEAFRVAG